jgi:Domain of unknown function (DUF4340)
MKLGKVLVYALILAGVATYIYVVEIRQKESQEASRKVAEKLIHFDRDKIDRILLDGAKDAPIELKKLSDTWVMIAPVKAKADEGAINAILMTLSMASREKLLSEKEVNWKDYGLDSPSFTVTAWTKDKKVTLQFGAKNPAKTSYYARVGNGTELLMVQDTLKNALNKTPFFLRDKSIVNIAPQDVDRLSITRAGKETEFERVKGDNWEMLKPQRIRVKSDALNRNLRTITNLTATEIIDSPKKEGDPYGLVNPIQRMVLSGEKLNQTLLIGQPKEGKELPGKARKLYAHIDGRDTVYEISSSQLNGLKTDPKQLRDRSLFSFNPADINKVEIDLEGTNWVLSRGKENKWLLTEPEKKDDLKSWPVTALLWSIKSLEWQSLEKRDSGDLSRYHLQTPKLTVRLHMKDAKSPQVLKAGWAQRAPKKDAENPEKGAKSSTEVDRKPAAVAEKPSEPATDSNADSKAKVPEAGHPDKLFATIEPHVEQDAVFVLDPRFLESLTSDLKKLLGAK